MDKKNYKTLEIMIVFCGFLLNNKRYNSVKFVVKFDPFLSFFYFHGENHERLSQTYRRFIGVKSRI